MMKTLLRLFLLALVVTGAAPTAPAAGVDLDLETARLTLNDRGAASITFPGDAAWPAADRPAFGLETDAGLAASRTCVLEGRTLRVEFENAATADFDVSRQRSFVLLRLTRFECDRPVSRLQLFALRAPADAIQIPTLGAAQSNDRFVAVMAGEPNVQCVVSPMPRGSSDGAGQLELLLSAQTVAKHGIEPAAFGVIACPASEMMNAIRRFEEAAKLPSPRPHGQWNKTSDAIRRSYLFLTRFKESQFDDALKIARRGGFAAILIGQESWCRSTGHYPINLENFPDGIDGLARTVDRFHAAGFRVGLHFLAPSIYPPDPYLTPVPDPRLVKDAATELTDAVNETADFLPAFAPQTFPAEDGGYNGNGTVLQVNDELIAYGGLSGSAKPGFAQCKRGHLGTKPTPHAKGAKVSHLARSYGYHMFDMDTSLLDEVASNFARVANACKIDMIYFDGSERLQGDHWYYNAKLHKAFFDKLDNKDMLIQASSFSPYSWHILARSASADGHGDIKGYLDERSPWFENLARGGMPLDIGWYYGYDPVATPDMFEYVLAATIGYDASMSYQVSVDAAADHPFSGEILDLIARYEKLRLSGKVGQEMRQRLCIPPALRGNMPAEQRQARLDQRREYRLITSDGKPMFQRVIYSDWHEIASAGAVDRTWPMKASSPGLLGVQIHALGGPWLKAGPSYTNPDAIVLESFDDLTPYQRGSALSGVTQRITAIDQGAPGSGRAALYTARSERAGPDGWSVVRKSFEPLLDLSHHRGIGLWLRGDSNGGLFKVQLGDGKGATDYYIANDYTGWRYHQLPRPQRDPIDYTRVRTLMFYYNGIPAGATVSCGIDDVKALMALDARELIDPYVEVGGHRFTWKGRLGDGQYAVLWPGEAARRYAPRLLEPESGAVTPPVSIDAGEYPVTFGSANDGAAHVRVRVTLQPAERHGVD